MYGRQGSINVDANRAYEHVGRWMAADKDLKKLEHRLHQNWLVGLYAHNLQDGNRTNYNDRCYLPGAVIPERTFS